MALQKLPMGDSEGTLMPASSQYEPSTHGVGALIPVDAQNVVGAQISGADMLVSLQYDPACENEISDLNRVSWPAARREGTHATQATTRSENSPTNLEDWPGAQSFGYHCTRNRAAS